MADPIDAIFTSSYFSLLALIEPGIFALTPDKNIRIQTISMPGVLSIGFSYLEQVHYTVIQVIEKPRQTEYHVTILNRELDLILNGSNVIIEEDGLLQIDLPSENREQANLKLKIAEALSDYLKVF